MPLLKHVANRPALVTLVFALLLLLGTACACPAVTGPTASLVIAPSNAVVVVGKTQQFCASGLPSSYTWTVNGGTFTTSGASCIIVTAGSAPGTYGVSVSASGQKATATMAVVAQ